VTAHHSPVLTAPVPDHGGENGRADEHESDQKVRDD
jgi:hypothetical protein